jgi:hypothetical protein
VVLATQAENGFSGCRIRQMLGAFSGQGSDKKTKESCAVSPPRSGGEAGMGFPPVDFLLEGGASERGVWGENQGGGKQHESTPLAA